jgi:LPXTG-site transpeptidase (sortase) family protein
VIIAAAVTAAAGELTANAADRAARPAAEARTAARIRDLRHERRIRAIPPPAIAIPAIGVSAGLLTLGGPEATAPGGGLTLPVPSLAEAAAEAGWYQFTAVPGAAGNAVIVGHVDTYAGPAVFYQLYQLRPGDLVYVTAGGTRRRFDVASVRQLPKAVFPVSQVFGETQKHVLWLITCGGGFDYATGHYLDNIVVSAALDPAGKSGPKPRQTALRKVKRAQAENSPSD